jgi:hypothetical protein
MAMLAFLTIAVIGVGLMATRSCLSSSLASLGGVVQPLSPQNSNPKRFKRDGLETVREIVRAMIIEQFAVTGFTDDSRFV